MIQKLKMGYLKKANIAEPGRHISISTIILLGVPLPMGDYRYFVILII